MIFVRPQAREVEVARLERLWEAPTADEPRVQGRTRPRERLWESASSRAALAFSWIVAVVTMGAAPLPADEADAPLVWWDGLYLGGLVLAAVGIGWVASRLARVSLGWSSSAVAGACGIIIGIACRATEHHPGNWWLAEAFAFGAVTAVSVAGAHRRRVDEPRRDAG